MNFWDNLNLFMGDFLYEKMSFFFKNEIKKLITSPGSGSMS